MDNHQICWPACISNHKATFSPAHLVFLELDIDQPHVDFKILLKTTTKLSQGHSTSNYQIKNEYMRQWNFKRWNEIFPDLNPTALQEPQSYRLNKLSEIEVFFLVEIELRKQIAKKMKRFNTITGIKDTGLITSTVITGEILSQHLPVVLAYPFGLL